MTSQLSPLSGVETTEKAQRALDRLKETFKVEELPAGLAALAGSEPGIHDVYMNLKRQFDGGSLSAPDKLLIALAVTSAAGSAEATRYLIAVAREAGAEPQRIHDAIAVGAVCTIYNTYYKFRHLAPEGEFDSYKGTFNANSFMKTSLSMAMTELINIAVSNLNDCNACVSGHLQKARQYEVTNDQVDEAIKAAAAATALARVASALG